MKPIFPCHFAPGHMGHCRLPSAVLPPPGAEGWLGRRPAISVSIWSLMVAEQLRFQLGGHSSLRLPTSPNWKSGKGNDFGRAATKSDGKPALPQLTSKVGESLEPLGAPKCEILGSVNILRPLLLLEALQHLCILQPVPAGGLSLGTNRAFGSTLDLISAEHHKTKCRAQLWAQCLRKDFLQRAAVPCKLKQVDLD